MVLVPQMQLKPAVPYADTRTVGPADSNVHARTCAWTRVLVLGAAALLAVGSAQPAPGATSSTVVAAVVPSATALSTAGCPSGSASVSFGVQLPGTSATTPADCVVVFGSSNDTSMLRVHQSDALGAGMWRPPTGPLNTSFNGTGKVTTAVGPGDDDGMAAVRQPDGKLVVAGQFYNGSNFDFGAVRYNVDGTLDLTFNGTGSVMTPIATQDYAFAVALQPDGKIVIGGCSVTGSYLFALVRYNPNGSLDTSFNGTGKVTTAFGVDAVGGAGIAVQGDGKIVMGGYTGGAGIGDFALARYNADGSLDTSFNGTGKVTTNFGGNDDVGRDMVLQPDGKIVQVGYSGPGAAWDVGVARFNIDGTLDTSFNGTGRVTTPVGGAKDEADAVVVQPDGKVVVAGYSGNGVNDDALVVRYTSAGALDTTFNGTGKLSLPLGPGNDTLRSLALEADGRIVASGYASNGANNDMATIRLNADGTLDTSFNGTGTLLTTFGASEDYAMDTLVGPDGSIDLVGYTGPAGSVDVAVARLATTPVADYVSGSADWALGTNAFGACLAGVSGGATTGGSTWQVNAACPTGGQWYAVPASGASAMSKVAEAGTGTITAQANIRFGLRTATGQPPGRYLAPVTFDVVAPNV